MHVASESRPKRMTTTLSSSVTIAWSTSQPECKCGRRYAILIVVFTSMGSEALKRVARVISKQDELNRMNARSVHIITMVDG